MLVRILLLLIIAKFFIQPVLAQQENADIRKGNREYRSGQYQDAELNYRKALENSSANVNALNNLAASLYKQGRYEEAAEILDGLAKMELPNNKKADVLYNLGNANTNNKKLKEAIEAYKDALRIRPQDADIRHNLAHAFRLLEEQEQQQQQQQQQEQSQEKGDDEQKQNQEQQQNQSPQPDSNQQEQQRPDQISPQDAQRILDALNQQEQKIQEKIDREQRQVRPYKPEREW
jgi:Ca-activated chloride channel homolog